MQEWLKKLESGKWGPLVQFIKFGLVGVSNTAISYGIEMLCFYVLFAGCDFAGTLSLLRAVGLTGITGEQVNVVYTTLLSFFISVTNSFYWNSRYVFKSGEQKHWFRAYLKTVACYGVTGLVIGPAIKLYLIGVGMPYWLASLSSLVVTIPLNFVLNKFWVYHDRQKKPEDERAENE